MIWSHLSTIRWQQTVTGAGSDGAGPHGPCERVASVAHGLAPVAIAPCMKVPPYVPHSLYWYVIRMTGGTSMAHAFTSAPN